MTVTLDKPVKPDHPLSARNLWSAALSAYLPMIIAVLVVALPLVWMVLASFKTPAELLTTKF